MGRLYLIEYDQTPDKRFYLCRSCQTHIASAQDFLSSTLVNIFFEKVVNVVIDDPVHYWRDLKDRTVANVLCIKCNILLGRKYVEVEEPTLEIREGTIRMEQKKLLFWNGKVLVDELPIPQSEAFV
ncbi:hypothetical protein F2P56_011087 [Juglans regia]|uniref:Protein yippee-like n=2 Tax=Juglans regia TaxID=51240 RepID=A0A834D063_JUGRE|nr:protein yippee-like At4g27740 [Juglans regia]KAF5470583.1 hypothetical protein F2P56_011087 [Juglans regia]